MTAASLAELGLLALCAWPLVKLAVNPDFARVAPRAHASLLTGMVGAAALVVFFALRMPVLLHALAPAVGVLAVVSAWRARPGLGRTRQWPPGSLSFTGSVEAIVQRDHYARQFKRHGAVFKMAQFHQGVVCLIGHTQWHDLLRAHRHDLGPSLQLINEDVRGGFLRYMDDDRHRVYARLFRSALGEPIVGAAELIARQAARRELQRAAVASNASGSVRLGEYLEAIVLATFAYAICGIDPAVETDEFRTLESAYTALKPAGLALRLSPRARGAFDDLGALIHRRAKLLRAGVDSGQTPVCAITELQRLDPSMPDDTCVDNLIMMLKIGSSNVLGLLSWIVKMLGDHPVWLERLRTEMKTDGSHSPGPWLADRVVMETLRLEQSEYLYRRVRTGFHHNGVQFPAGWQVRLCVRESHRRDDVFEEPDRFNPDRFVGRTYTKAEYSPFGTGRHACNGADLTNLICRVIVEQLASGFDLSTAQDGPPERDFRHWSHWRPSSRLRVTITPLEPKAISSTEAE